MTEAYDGSVNHGLLDWTPLDASRVLELGCGEGALAAAYKRRNPRATYVAVERSAAAAAVARTRVDQLIEGDFETLDDAEIAAGGLFDVVVLGDVLERLTDPWRVLRRLRDLLEPDGTLVLCAPNIGHWSAQVELLAGRWPYAESGLFDRTHLRFFTLQSLNTLLDETGFRSRKGRAVELKGSERSVRTIRAIADAAAAVGLDRAAAADRAGAYQYLVAAEKAGEPEAPIARVCMLAMSPRFLDVRTRLPAAQLGSLADLSVVYAEKNLRLPRVTPATPRILVQQRPREADEDVWLRRIAPLISRGWLIITEMDDHPLLVEQVGGQVGCEVPMTAVHAVQTSTPRLREAFKAYNPEVATFGNAMFELPPFVERGAGKVFFGALNRERFSTVIAKALAPAIEAHPEVEFVVMHDRAFFGALPTQRKRFLPAAPYADYQAAMAACDVALMPLEGTEGEVYKSDLKFLEASGGGLASIASPAVYADTIRHGETGLIAASVDDWPLTLSRVVGEPGLRSRLARAAWEYVRDERMFAYQTGARRDWYLSLWKRREALNAALLQRHPMLETYLAEAAARSQAATRPSAAP